VTLLDLLFKYLLLMEHRFDAMLYSNLGNKNSDAGCFKCFARAAFGSREVPYPWCRVWSPHK